MSTPKTDSEQNLIQEQISKNFFEITFQRLVFSIACCLSMAFIFFVAYRLIFFEYNEKEDYSKFLTAAISLLVPYLTYVAQGFSYPKRRRIAILRHLLNKTDISTDDIKTIYEK
jgi:hypothetical protein